MTEAQSLLTLRDLAQSVPPWMVDQWNALSDDEKRERAQGYVSTFGMQFTPDPLVLIWLLEQAGVEA